MNVVSCCVELSCLYSFSFCCEIVIITVSHAHARKKEVGSYNQPYLISKSFLYGVSVSTSLLVPGFSTSLLFNQVFEFIISDKYTYYYIAFCLQGLCCFLLNLLLVGGY